MPNYRISFQLYGARNFPPLEQVLEGLAAIGYEAIEPYGPNYQADPAGLRRKADALGLAIPTAHMPLADLNADRAKLIDTARTLGLETVVMPYIAAEARPKDGAGWKELAHRLSDHAGHLAEAGLKLAWHNHDFEYARLPDGSRPIDHLLAANGVHLEADLGWIFRAGADVAKELRRDSGRLVAIHVKDSAKAGTTTDDGWTDVGAGVIDWKQLWPAIAASGANLLVMEHDNPSDWRSFAANSYKYVSGLTGRG
jgi:sugar phosphate isomerase/epimerase